MKDVYDFVYYDRLVTAVTTNLEASGEGLVMGNTAGQSSGVSRRSEKCLVNVGQTVVS